MVNTKDNSKNLPSATTLAGSGRRTTPRSGSRQTKPTEKKNEELEKQNEATEQSIEKVSETLFEDVLLDAKLPNECDEIDLDLMEDHTCEAIGKLSVTKVQGMYARYQLQWQQFVEKKKIKNEVSDVKLLDFFKSIRKKYAPSTLWVIYSCLNSYFIDKYGKNLREMPRLTKYLKKETHLYVAKQSLVFKPDEIHSVLIHCVNSKDPHYTHMGVTIALMYYGLLRSTDVLQVKCNDVSIEKKRL